MRLRYGYTVEEIHEVLLTPCGSEIADTGKYDMELFVSFNRVPGGRWDEEMNVIEGKIDITGLGIDTFKKAEAFCKKLTDEVLVKGYLDLSDHKWCGRDVEIY